MVEKCKIEISSRLTDIVVGDIGRRVSSRGPLVSGCVWVILDPWGPSLCLGLGREIQEFLRLDPLPERESEDTVVLDAEYSSLHHRPHIKCSLFTSEMGTRQYRVVYQS